MRNRQLHAALSAFAEEAAWQLQSDTSEGADLSFDVVAAGPARQPALLLPPAHRQLHLRAREPARPPAELPARARRAARLRRARGLPRVARRARAARPARARRVGAAHVPRPRLRGLDRLHPRGQPPQARAARDRGRDLRQPGRDGRHRAAARARDRLVGPAAGRRPVARPRRRVRRGGARRGRLGARRRPAAPARRAALGGGRRRCRARRPRRASGCAGCSPRCASSRPASFAFGPLAWTRTGGGTVAAVRARHDRPPHRRVAHRHARAGGRAARVLQPHLPPHPAQRRDRVGAAPVRDGLRPPRPGRGAERPPPRAARAPRAGGPGVGPPRRPGRRALRDRGGAPRAHAARRAHRRARTGR